MENNILLAIFVLLTASVVLVTFARALGIGSVLGYLLAGILIGPFGLGLVSDNELIHHIADLGIVMMLFLIGLDLQPSELWHMRHRVVGLGVTQVVATSALVAAMMWAIGFTPNVAVIIGLALSMSSTAIAMQTVQQRDITRTDAGRATLAILLVQDVAVIPILAAIPLLAFSVQSFDAEVTQAVESLANPLDWITPLTIIAAFGLAMLAGRYLVRPLLNLVARSGVREAFTAMGLAIVLGAALLAQAQGFSPALGAFIGGVLLADSEYRHELQSNLEPFKGLLLGLFFVSVGMSVSFDVLWSQPMQLGALVLAFVGIKAAVIFALGSLFRMHVADKLLVAILLSQAGEFAFVIFQFARSAGALADADHAMLAVAVALSMATTPLLLLAFDHLLAPRVSRSGKVAKAEADSIDTQRPIVVLGYGRFGQIVTRMLRAQGFQMTLIDDDPAQIELVRKFGVKVFYGDGSRLDLLHAAGLDKAAMVVIAVGGHDRILDIARKVRRHFPHVTVAARAVDRGHAHELMALGVEVFERETFLSAVSLGTKVLIQLGVAPVDAMHMAQAFERHDNQLLQDSYAVRDDEAAFMGMVRSSMGLLNQAMRADLPSSPAQPKPDTEGS
jgi:glutathione-regulated potassium-efflux system ancillary protein KefC